MDTNPKKNYGPEEESNEKPDKNTTNSGGSSSFPGEAPSTSLDEDIDPSIIENEPRSKAEKDRETAMGPIRRIRTYKEDIAEAVRTQKASLTSIAAAEQKKRVGIPRSVTEKRKVDFKKVGIISGSIIFIILGLGLLAFFFFFYEKEEVAIEREVASLFFVENQIEVAVSNKTPRAILQSLKIERARVSIPLGQIAQLYLTETIPSPEQSISNFVSGERFLTIIDAQVSGAFMRSLNIPFMLGVHVFNQNQPFIIFKSNSYEHSFAGILEWEKTIYHDLFLFVGRDVDPILGVAIDPQTGEEIVLREDFEDIIVQNIDARALLNEGGGIELLYSFPNQGTLIITTNENTLAEIITRLNSVRVF